MRYLYTPSYDLILQTIAVAFRAIPVGEFESAVVIAGQAEAVGPILNPSGWNADAIRAHRLGTEVLQAALAFRKSLAQQDAATPSGLPAAFAEDPARVMFELANVFLECAKGMTDE